MVSKKTYIERKDRILVATFVRAKELRVSSKEEKML
jgi:hypothetical protein